MPLKNRTPGAVRRATKTWDLRGCGKIAILFVIVVSGCSQGTALDAQLGGSEKAAARQVQGTAAAAAILLNVYMDARIADVRALASTCERLGQALIKPETRSETSRLLQEWQKISGAYDAAVLLDKSGSCVAASSEGLLNKAFADDASFQEAVSGKLTIGDARKSDVVAFVDPKSNGWTLSISAPIAIGGEVAGILMSYLKWSRLQQLTSSFRVGETGYVFVLNSENQVIVHPSNALHGIGLREPRLNLPQLDEAVRNRAPYKRYKFKIMRTKTGTFGTRLVGLAYPRGYANFPGLGWTVGAGAEEKEITGGNSFWRLFRLSSGHAWHVFSRLCDNLSCVYSNPASGDEHGSNQQVLQRWKRGQATSWEGQLLLLGSERFLIRRGRRNATKEEVRSQCSRVPGTHHGSISHFLDLRSTAGRPNGMVFLAFRYDGTCHNASEGLDSALGIHIACC